MATPSEKLAHSLEALHELQKQGYVAIRSSSLSRIHRERLCANGFLEEVMKGWYIPTRPDETAGESTAWFAGFWAFCTSYLTERFGEAWSLSPEQSLSLHVGNRTVPRQLVVRAGKARNKVTALVHGTSILEVRAALPDPADKAKKEGLFLFSLPSALLACSPGFFRQNPIDARAALASIQDGSELLSRLLEGGHTTIAGRLAGAFSNIGRERLAKDIIETMHAAGYKSIEQDPFEHPAPITLTAREASPHINRLRLMWQNLRGPVLEAFPKPPGLSRDIDGYLQKVSDAYLSDAYHSLSIEGYRVNTDLIERVRSGDWNPDTDEGDRDHRSALAARGYWLAYQAVRKSVERVLKAENAGQVADEDHGGWYREMFAPSVTAGILRPADLAGYRNGQVYIRRSMHVPPNHEAARELMPAFFDLLREEKEPAVRAVLGHFVFVYIHPYMDGNGRIGRFLMNVMLASGGYPWTVIPVESRDVYMAALERASVNQDISAFAGFLAKLMSGE